ncbi:MAG: hypothetical protein ACRYGA_12860 [Janthinobacterium lividum]
MQNEEYRSSETSVTRGRLARAAFFIIAIVLLSFVALLGYRVWAQMPDDEDRQRLVQQHPLMPPGVSIRPTSKPVIGDLGGLRVTFPPGFVRNAEYEGDPEFGHKRIGPKPERTHQSSLVSLGFDVRYPEIVAISVEETRLDKSNYTIYNTPWLSVHITAGVDFGDGQFLERVTASINRDTNFQFRKLPRQFHGLDVYTPSAVDANERNRDSQGIYKNDARDIDVFVHYDKENKVDNFIRCSNRNHRAAPCEHDFFLGQGVKTHVTVSSRRGMLENWEDIQYKTKKLIFTFRSS